jgi:hypothetical protein
MSASETVHSGFQVVLRNLTEKYILLHLYRGFENATIQSESASGRNPSFFFVPGTTHSVPSFITKIGEQRSSTGQLCFLGCLLRVHVCCPNRHAWLLYYGLMTLKRAQLTPARFSAFP